MNPVEFQIVRVSDKELLDILRAMVVGGDGRPACIKLRFDYLSGGQFEVKPTEIDGHKDLNAVVMDDT